ncbi:hypothetical protein DFH09DRAFT_1097506 [Mycena vulgaris]|nr:hypothetical protein DFH09DRAFT_1097506 [Mycena vulgaris]
MQLLNGATEVYTTWNWVAVQMRNCSMAWLKSDELRNCATACMKFTTCPYIGNCAVSQVWNCSMVQLKSIQLGTGQLSNCGTAQWLKLQKCSTAHMKFTAVNSDHTYIGELCSCTTAEQLNGATEVHTTGNWAAEQLQNCSMAQLKSVDEPYNGKLHSDDRELYSCTIAELLNGATEVHTIGNWAAAHLRNCSMAQLKSGELQNCATARMKLTTVYLQPAITRDINCPTAQLHSGGSAHTLGSCADAQFWNCSMAQLKSVPLVPTRGMKVRPSKSQSGYTMGTHRGLLTTLDPLWA